MKTPLWGLILAHEKYHGYPRAGGFNVRTHNGLRVIRLKNP